MNLTDRITITAHVKARQIGDDTVILDLATGTYFGLDAVGARMWQLMEEGKTLSEICDVMGLEYEVSRSELEGDLISLVEELLVRNLVEHTQSGAVEGERG
jgi:Coenzyme PQQ synthesis protein D (PqqD)